MKKVLIGVAALADVSVLVLDEIRKDVGAMVWEKCPKLNYVISMQKTENEGNVLSMQKMLPVRETEFERTPSKKIKRINSLHSIGALIN